MIELGELILAREGFSPEGLRNAGGLLRALLGPCAKNQETTDGSWWIVKVHPTSAHATEKPRQRKTLEQGHLSALLPPARYARRIISPPFVGSIERTTNCRWWYWQA
jgi:hypothetical protein